MNQESYPLQYKITLTGPSNHLKTVAPVDTLAQTSIINFEVLKFLGYKKKKLHHVTRISLDGMSLAYIAKVQVNAERKKFNLDMAAVRNFQPRIVLGIDFLRKIDNLTCYLKDFSHLYTLIKQSKRKCVLIIGDDKNNFDVLYLIKRRLRTFGYEGILLKEYQDIEEQSIEEKMNMFGNLARFVICENSYPSGHIDELNICTRNRLITIILQEKRIRGGATWMQSCYSKDFNFIKRILYKPATLISAIDKALKIGEYLVAKRKRAFNKEYKYRKEWFRKLSKKG